MTIKVAILTVFTLLGSLAVAHAQTPTSAAQGTANYSSTSANGQPAATPTTGWHFVHTANCYTFNDGAGNIWLYVYSVEGGVFATADPNFQNAIAPACQTGNWIAFLVTDATTGAWSQVFTYTFK